MEFDEIVVKESPGLCRCCLSEGCYKDMGSEYTWMNENEVYADMLLECFDISISQHNDGPNGPNRLICEVCITRLRDACNFKKQVLDSEKKFVDMIGRGEFRPKVLIYQTQMKAEAAEELEDTEVEFLEEDLGDYGDDDEPLKSSDQEPSVSLEAAAVPARRGRPRKTPAKADKKRKLEERPKTSKAVVKGPIRQEASEAESKSFMTATKRNKLMKSDVLLVLEHSSAMPFKWQRHNYLCFFCHRAFQDTELLKEHTKADHKNSSLTSAVSYIRRDEKVKLDVSSLYCKECNIELSSLEKLIEHLKAEHDKIFNEECGFGMVPYKLQNDNLRCAVCNEEFQYFIKLNQHMNVHFGSYICEVCGKSFLSQDRLRCHSLQHGMKFRCNICSESFDSLVRRNSHEAKVHNKDKRMKCNYCPETFTNYAIRKRHHNLVHNIEIQKFNCPVCQKSFLIMSRMQAHFKEVHAREKNFSCSMCDQKFFSRTLVQKHMLKHCGERVHQCEVCLKSYARKQTLKDHMRIHSKDKKSTCLVCGQEFIQSNSLRLHMRGHHPDVTV